MQKVHLDTDFGGDLDDFCALALLLRWSPAIEITGITVVADLNGRRTGMVRRVLEFVGRSDIPVAAGAETSQGFYPYELGLPDETRYWSQPITPSPNSPEEAMALLRASIDAGATLIGIGPLTNFYLLDQAHPGALAHADLVLMGGYVYPPRPGYPQWSHREDFNVQVDVRSATHVLQQHTATLIPLTVTAETALRRAHLGRLRKSGGALGKLLAHQAEEFARDEAMAEKYAAIYANVPTDIINFHHDPLACAVALGWDEGLQIEEIPLVIGNEENWLTMRPDPNGRPFRVVTQVDGPRFNEFWLDVLTNGG